MSTGQLIKKEYILQLKVALLICILSIVITKIFNADFFEILFINLKVAAIILLFRYTLKDITK
ncbi:MAG: hypothetical protein DRG78_06250 [Epsilonproteobacteria bacterium]|nr:MAG: hypothetical protein DRG78_06250 [Campylobacterota bacterium]